jgi:hypothetical protein
MTRRVSGLSFLPVGPNQMRSIIAVLGASFAAFCLIITTGCGGDPPPGPPVAHEHEAHEHEAHEHEAHEHEAHEHEAHEHEAHEHEAHEHATTIDADAMGLDVDDLVSVDKPDLPDNYDDAVNQLVKLRDVIRDAFHSDDAEAAHNPLHEIGYLLEKIESIVAKDNHDAEHKKVLTAAVDELFDSYTLVDETFHSDSGKEYSEVESKIDSAVKTLQDHIGHE